MLILNILDIVFLGLDGCAMKHFEVSPDGKYLAFIGRFGSIHILTAQVCRKHIIALTENIDIIIAKLLAQVISANRAD